MNLNFETDGVNFNNKGKPDEIATPIHICRDMSNLFDYTNCNQKIWMDIFCKTGNTLEALKENGVSKNNIAAVCNNKQSQMLACRKLYGELLPEIEIEITVKSLEAYKITRRGQVYWISNYKDIVKNHYQNAYNIIKFVIIKEMEKTMQLEWNSDKEFQINNIIMNPPYNNDMYIDFVTLAKNIASNSVVAITPAKWQAKGGEKNEAFRRGIVPYMKKIVYYPDTTEIFDISETGGITYYLIDKNEHKIKDISLECELLPELRHNNSNIDFSNYICMQGNKIRDIITKCNKKESDITDTWDFSQSKYIKNTDRGRINKIQGDLEVMQGEEVCGYISKSELFTEIDIDKYKVITPVITSGTNPFTLDHKLGRFVNMYCIKPMQIPKGSFLPLFRSYDKEECMSFISYNYCKLIQFLLFFGICGTTTTGNFWRFVPNPGKFDHIFTDTELYQKYDLTPDEIAIIESVIKERK